MSNSPVSVVTGANSGIGRATALHLAAGGHTVYGTVRSVGKADKLRAMAEAAGTSVELVELDVADDDSVIAGFDQILGAAGRVDNLVNNAGIASNAVVEECPPSLFDEIMNVNLNGAVRCIRAVLPQMRERGSGTIVNVSSIVGRFGAMAMAPYVASKWALEGVSEELALEVAPFGVRVVIVEPGVTKSAMLAKNIDVPNSTGAYGDQYRRSFQMFAAGIADATDPFEVAEVIRRAVDSGTEGTVLRHLVSWGAAEIIGGRDAMSDDDWIALGASGDDEEYVRRFADLFGLDISG